jgi:hypothetical protein
MTASAGVGISWGGRLSAFKDAGWERYFRAVEFQGDLGYSRPLGDPPGDDIYFDPVIDYSFPYLYSQGAAEIPWPLRNLCVFADLNFDLPLRSRNSSLTMFLTPGVSYLSHKYQISAGVQIAMNNATSSNEKTAVIGSVLIFLDALDPVFRPETILVKPC